MFQLMTEEEMDSIPIIPDGDGDIGMRQICYEVAKAQLKKVVDWIEENAEKGLVNTDLADEDRIVYSITEAQLNQLKQGCE